MDNIKFFPILNFQEHGCTCSILTINNINILLECGCPETLTNADLNKLFQEAISSHLPNIHIALISHELITHIGFIPLLAKFPSKTRVILTTSPVCKIGHITLYDFYYSRNLMEQFDLYNLDQVDSTFESMKTLKYKEKFTFEIPNQDKDSKIKFVPLPSGGTIGGVTWKITYKMLRILYIARPYMKSEIISDGLVLSELPKIADLVIMDSHVTKGSDSSRENRKNLKKLVQEQLEKKGTIIIPTDSGSRGLELVASLKRFLEKNQEKIGANAKMLYIHTMSEHALETARIHMEWMSSKISQVTSSKATGSEFLEDKNDKHFQCITSMSEFAKIKPEGGRIIICSHYSLNYGLSYSLLQQFIEDPNCVFVIPFKPQLNTFAHYFKKMKASDLVKLSIPEKSKLIAPSPIRKHSEIVPKIEPMQLEETKMIFEIKKMPDLSKKESSQKIKNDRATLYFKETPFKCFEDAEKKRKIDEFGELISENEKNQWKKLNPTEENISNLVDPKKKPENSNAVVVKLRKPEYSANYMYSYRTLRVVPKCKFIFTNLEGINDSESLHLTLKFIQPKKVILYNASQSNQKEIMVNF